MHVLSRYLLRAAVVIALLVPFAPAPGWSQAAQGKLASPVVVVLDMRVIMRESVAGKAWQEYYDGKVKAHKDQIAAEEKALRPAWEELQRQRSILAPEAFQQRERDFREKEAAVNRRIAGAEQELGNELRNTFEQVRQVIEGHLRPIRDQIVAEKGIDIVLLVNPDVNYVGKSYEITGLVLKQLDRNLPKINIPALAEKAKKGN